MKLFILAGEPSGDRIAADLVTRMRAKTDVDLTGVGGSELESVGLKSMFPMRELSIMGWSEIIRRLPWLYFRAWQVARAIIRSKPDVVVFVDAQLFSAAVARQVRKAGAQTPIVLYVAPSVWAWAPERASELRPLYDEVLAVLPFEPKVMEDLQGSPTSYVGHPAVSRLQFRDRLPDRGPLLLLPGSRDRELRNHLPLLRAAAEQLQGHSWVTEFVMPTLSSLAPRLETEVAGWGVPVRVVSGPAARDEVFAEATGAIAVSGTVTLELALVGVPMVVTYVADQSQVKKWLRYNIRFAALPNTLLGRPLVPELLGPVVDGSALADAIRGLLDNPDTAAAQYAGFAEIRRLMEQGAPEAPLTDAADRVIAAAQRSAIGV